MCGQAISEEVKKSEMAALRERLADLEGLLQGAREELSEYAEVGTAVPRLEGHRKSLARRTKLVEEQSKLQAVKRPNGSDLESRMIIFVERINKGERVLEMAQQAESATERWQAYVRQNSALEAKIGLLDKLTEFFGPNGAMMSQSSGRIGSFTENLNRHLAAFGYSCSIVLEPFEIRVTSSSDARLGFSLKQLSESERFRFSIAFQIALAIVTGLRFVVIDRADVLDKDRRKLLTGLLMKSGLDQAIVLATSDEAAPSIVPQGVRFLTLPEGMKRDQVLASTAA
jgi:DNA repair exonuclease SbcCD ATPase subunit